jgi:hypothetical protein
MSFIDVITDVICEGNINESIIEDINWTLLGIGGGSIKFASHHGL